MRVLFIENAGLRSAGAFHSLVALICLLKKNGAECFVALPDRSDSLDFLIENGIQYISLRACSYTWTIKKDAPKKEYYKMPLKDFMVKAAALKLARFIRENHIDIVHENTSACYIGYYAARLAKVKHIWHIREFMEEDFNVQIWRKKRALKMMDSSDGVIVISKALLKKYAKVIDEKKLRVIYNGITVEKFYNSRKEIFNNASVTLLCAGRLCEGKGQKDLIKAIGILKKEYQMEPLVLFAGLYSDKALRECDLLAHKEMVRDNIRFLGQVDNMKQIYEKADIFCMCSRCEAFGRVTVEAMLSGNLIIGANSGGTPEILEDGKFGLLYTAANSQDLAEKILFALKNKAQMKALADTGRLHALKTYDAIYNSKNIYQFYTELVSEN